MQNICFLNGNLTGQKSYVDTDLNTLTTTGVYWVRIAPETPHGFNFPEDAVNGWLQVITTDAPAVKQIFYRYGTKNITGNYTYIRTSYSNGWSDWIKLVTNSDLSSRFNPIEISGVNGDTFKNVLKNKCNNAVNFIVFNGSTENPISDNPFTSKNGYVIAFNSDRLNAYNYFILLGITIDMIEVKSFDARQ